jgi:hypothetical protein
MVGPLEYTHIGTGKGDRGSVEEFLLRSLLAARDDAGLPSNRDGFDEDVNVYVVGLLGRFLSSEYHDEVRRFSYPTDLDLAREVETRGNDRFRYLAYRTNADQLLLGIGLFCHVDGHGVSPNPVFGRSADELTGRGSTYYRIASASLRRLRRRNTGPETAMSKLAEGFDTYTTILRRLRTNYFRLTTRLGAGTLYHLSRGTDAGTRALSLARDRFLDAWLAWKEGTGELEPLRIAAGQLRELDPEFCFELPEA